MIIFDTEIDWTGEEYVVTVVAGEGTCLEGQGRIRSGIQPVPVHTQKFSRYSGSRGEMQTWAAETFLRKLEKLLAVVEDHGY